MNMSKWICGALAVMLCFSCTAFTAYAKTNDEIDELIEVWKNDREELEQEWNLNPDEPFGSTPTAEEIDLEEALRIAIDTLLSQTRVTIPDLKNHHLNFFFIDNADGALDSPVAANQRAWYFVISNKDTKKLDERGFFVVVDGTTGEVTNLIPRKNVK